MSRLSDALGVPEGKPFEFRGAEYVIKGNRRHCKTSEGMPCANNEDGLTRLLDNASEIKLIPTRYKRKEPEIVKAYRVGDEPVPEWFPSFLPSHVHKGYYIVLDAEGVKRSYTPEKFESTFEKVE